MGPSGRLLWCIFCAAAVWMGATARACPATCDLGEVNSEGGDFTVFDWTPLPKALALVKVPETGSSTAANLLAELARKRNTTCFGVKLCGETAESEAAWSLGHLRVGKQQFLITTARDPVARMVSYTYKNGCSGSKPCDCAPAVGIALNYWGLRGERASDVERALAGDSKTPPRFDAIWVTERYNESLVVFALRHGLPLGDVLAPLSKVHVGTDQALQAKAMRACAHKRAGAEAAVVKFANAKLDADSAALVSAGVDVPKLVRAYEAHVEHYLQHGGTVKAAQSTDDPLHSKATLSADGCVRKCAAKALDERVRIRYRKRPK
ncbi:hypothetical protein M885DRAFT_616985 [Pelagophyceae sp. CCMP2097]|nr:hypothetical protein M885DRAFT_616985 [Pelagophyceae sp. CCMP2097]